MDPDLQEKIDTWTPDPHTRPGDSEWFPPVFEAAPFGIAAMDLRGNFVRVNKAFCLLHGREAREVEMLNVSDLTVSGDGPAYEASMAQARAGEATLYRNEHRIERPDGTERWALITATTVHDSSGEPAYALLQYHDTTDLHEIREAARLATETLDLTIENAPIAIYSVDLEGKVLTWNPMSEQLFGWSVDEVIGKEIPIVSDEGRDLAYGGLDQLLGGQAIKSLEATLIHRDGHAIEVLTSASVTHDPDGTPHAIVAFAMDISGQRKLERALHRNQKYLKLVFGKISDTVTVIDERGRVKYSTIEFSDVLGYPADFWREHTFFDLVHPDDLARTEEFFSDVLAVEGVEFSDVVRIRTPDGGYRPIEGTGINLINDPEINGVIITSRDLTDYRRTQDLLADEARVLGLIARGAHLDETLTAVVKMVERHTQGGMSAIVFVDDDGTYRTGPAPSLPADLVEAIDNATVVWPVATAIETGETIVIDDVDTVVGAGRMSEDAHRFGIAAGWSTPIIDSGHQVALGAICTSYDTKMSPTNHELHVASQAANLAAIAIERQRAQDQLHDQAHNDELTGLPNRRHLMQRLEDELAAASSHNSGVAVLFVDLDRFKVINDSLGHTVGDHLLHQFGQRLRDLVGPAGFVGRLSADDFLVVMTGVDSVAAATPHAMPIVTELDQALNEPFALDPGAGDIHLSTSVGMAHSSDSDGTADNLVQLAGAAMYRAKELGHDRMAVFDEGMRTRANERMRIENDLHLAMERNELVVHYQPKIDLDKGTIVGAEALLRWEHPDRGLILPARFIPIAEETGMIVPIGRFVLEEAIRQARQWSDDIPGAEPLIMAVNFSARQISTPDLITNVARVLLKHSWPPERLSLELTESVLVDDADSTLDVLNELTQLGVKLAIDDFGTGYSSLSYLHRFPVDIVKIDRAFVSELAEDGSGSAVVTAVMHMAEALELVTSAEGVETADQLAGLRRLGCKWAQGYLFARPLDAESVTELLISGTRW